MKFKYMKHSHRAKVLINKHQGCIKVPEKHEQKIPKSFPNALYQAFSMSGLR